MRHVLTILAVDDLPRATGFYRAALGWRQSVEAPVYSELEAPTGERLGLYRRERLATIIGREPERVPPGAIAATELYFWTAEPAAAIERLRQAGARELSALAPRDWGDEAAYFADPEGNIVVVARPLAPVDSALTIDEAGVNEAAAVSALLTQAGLPVPDAADPPVRMLAARREGRLIGCCGWERYGGAALLRSVTVDPSCQGGGVGTALVRAALDRLRASGAAEVYLLTTGASGFFARFGFESIERSATSAIAASREIRMACCQGAACMRKPL